MVRSVTPLLAYDEICVVIDTVGKGDGHVSTPRHESIPIEQLKNPTPEVAAIVYQRLVDCSRVAEHMHRPRNFQYPVLFQEAVQQQMLINGAKILARLHDMDFGVDDIANPEPKRMRRLLSHFINYCRFETDIDRGCDELLEQRRQKVAALEDLRIRNQSMETNVEMARGRNEDEEPALMEGMKACQQVESLENQKASKKREVDEQARKADLRLAELQNSIQAQVQRRENLLEMKEDLKMQVAESPEAIQASIADLDSSSDRKRVQKTQKAQEKQNRATRMRELEKYRKEVETHISKAKELAKKDERMNKEKQCLKEQSEKLEHLRGKLESVQEESGGLERDLSEVTAQQEEDDRDYKSKMADLMDTLKEAQKKCAEEESMRDGLSREDCKKRRERDALQEEISSLTSSEQLRINEMRDELQALRRSTQDYKLRVNEIFSKQRACALGGA